MKSNPVVKFRLECFYGSEITSNIIREVSNFYRFMFNNEHEHYLASPLSGKIIGPKEVFSDLGNSYADLTRMDSLDLDCYTDLITGEIPVFYHCPTRTESIISQMLKSDGCVAILRGDDLKICGAAFGYTDTVENVFRNEYARRYQFSKADGQLFENDSSIFFDRIEQVTGLSESDGCFSLACVGTIPGSGRGINNYLSLLKGVFSLIPESKRDDLLVIGESRNDSVGRMLYSTAKLKPVESLCSCTKSSVLVASAEELIELYNKPRAEYIKILKDVIRNQVVDDVSG